MDREAHISAQQLQYIARISGGKDGFKMLDVIVSRGLPLDRITTTDIWATDTIRGEHPKMVEFKVRADEYIWRKYRIEVEHLCAMRNGKKVTYEQMFYHVPKRRRDAGGGGATNRERSEASRTFGTSGANRTSNEERPGRPQGFPAQRSSWCKKLKIDYVRLDRQAERISHAERAVVPKAQAHMGAGHPRPLFGWPRREGR